jgi:hypothetical protein
MTAIEYFTGRLSNPALRAQATRSAKTRAENIERLGALYRENPRTETSVATIQSLEISLGLDAFNAPPVPPPDSASFGPWREYLGARFLGAAAPSRPPQALIVLAAPGSSSEATIESLSQWFASQRGCVLISPDELLTLSAWRGASNAESAPQETQAREIANDLLARAMTASLNLLITTQTTDAQAAIALLDALSAASIRSAVIALSAPDREKTPPPEDRINADLAFANAIRAIAAGPHADELHIITPEGDCLASICRTTPAPAKVIDNVFASRPASPSSAPAITLPDGRTVTMKPPSPAPARAQSAHSDGREPPQPARCASEDIVRRRRWKEKVARWAAGQSRDSS